MSADFLKSKGEHVALNNRPSRSPRWANEILPPVFLIAFVLFAWQTFASRSGISDFILPSPTQIMRAGWETRVLLGKSIAITMVETIVGLAIAILLGLLIAGAMDLSSVVRRALYPILVASQTVQILAIAPLFIIWFGFGLLPKVIIVVLITFFPLAVSTADGLASADADLVALLITMGAKKRQIWRMVRLPTALPSFFSGLRIAVTYSVVGATIGEWVGGSAGLGLYMLRSKNALATDQVFVAIAITTGISIGLFLLIYLVERALLPWYYAARGSEQWEQAGIY